MIHAGEDSTISRYGVVVFQLPFGWIFNDSSNRLGTGCGDLDDLHC